MSPPPSLSGPADTADEIASLIDTLQRTERRLVELTSGEVDAVADSQGKTYLLRHAQEQMRHNVAAKQASILNALPAHIALLDTQGRIITVNETWRRFAHTNVLAPGYGIGLSYLEACDEACGNLSVEAKRVAAGIRAVLSGAEKGFSIEYPCHSSSEECWFLLTVTPLEDERRNGVVVMHSNITARKHAETEARKSEKRLFEIEAEFRILAESLPQIVWITRPNGENIYFNQQWMKYTGLTLQESLGHGWNKPFHPEDQQRARDAWQLAVATGGTYSLECRLRRADGIYRWWLIRGVPQKDAAGNLLKWFGTCTDINDMKHAELEISSTNRALREIAANMAAAQRIAHFGSWELLANNLVDIDENSLRWSDEMFRIAGFLPGEVEVTNALFFSLVPVEEHESIREAMKSAIRDRRQYSIVHRLIRPDGVVRHVHETAEFFFDEKTGELSKIVGTTHDITERRHAETAMQRQQNELRVLFDLMPAMIWFKDTENGILRINRRVAESAGKSIEEIEGKSMFEIYPREAAKYFADDLEVIKSGIPKLNIIEKLSGANGEDCWVQTDKVPVCNEQGKVTGIVVMAQDISARKLAEEILQKSEERLRFLSDLAKATRTLSNSEQIMSVMSQMLGMHLGASRCAYATMADDGDQFTILHDYTHGCATTVGNYHLSLFGARAVACLKSGQPLIIRDVEAELLPGEGSDTFKAIDIRAIISCPLVKEGRLRALIAVHQTTPRDWKLSEIALVQEVVDRYWATIERRAAQDNLRQSEALLRIAGRTAQLGGWAVDLPGTRFTCSDQVCAILEVPHGSVPGLDQVINFYAPHSRDTFSNAFAACAEHGTSFDLELEINTVKGRRAWMRCTGEVQCDAAGTATRMQGAIQDITERYHAEEALRKSEDQLRQSQKMDAVGQLAGGVAHDFNNLLTVIMGRAELLENRTDLAENVLRSIKLIKQTGSKAASLTRQLLQFSRQQVLQPQVIDLNVLVPEMQEMLQRLISEDIDLVLTLSSKAGKIKADPGQIQQVVMNLVINARDAMPLGGKLTIETRSVFFDEQYCAMNSDAVAGPHLMLAVTDTGCGMDEKVRARIFEPFFTTKEQGKGTGLGLSTVYGIVKQAGGNIYVYSEVNHGTTFKVYFPEAAEKSPSEVSASEHLPVKGGGETILLVEDELDIRNLLSEILRDKGYTVIVAKDGQDAINCSENFKEQIDLLLTDVVMPKMNGKEVATQILRSRPAMKTMFMSGYTSDAIVSRGVLDEGINFLEKPFTPTSAAKRVREVLDNL